MIENYYTCIALIITWVSGALSNLYFLNKLIKHILASIIANLIPIQLRGPEPNGM